MSRPLVLAVLVALGACSEETAPPPPVRPVLSVLVTPQQVAGEGFTGIVAPKVSRDLGFRVLGRVVARDVDVGQAVTRGQRLAALDPLALNLVAAQVAAQLAQAEAQAENAAATMARKQTLAAQRVASQADLDAAREGQAAADAAVARARADLDKAHEQLSYTQLVAEADGIVTAVNVEVGQTVTAGQTVLTVAEAGTREAVIDVPDDIAIGISPGDSFAIALQIDPDLTASGRVREMAPQADAATRTRRLRLTLEDAPPSFRIGTTVTARLSATDLASFDLPPSALLRTGEGSFVWIVDPQALTVSRRAVEVASETGARLRIRSGIEVGARVVIAGVHSLIEGQKVRIDQEIGR